MFEDAVSLNACGRWPDDVSIWRLDMPSPPESQATSDLIAACHASLDMAERQRADRYRVAAERVRFVITRGMLRKVLSIQTTRPAMALKFVSVANGRPALADFPALSFNVSHAGHHALIALSHRRVVGVDIEYIDPDTDWASLVDMVCSNHQRDQLRPADGRKQFFKCWTAKEAILKALGVGLTDDLGEIEFSLDVTGVQRPRTATLQGADKLSFHWLTDVVGYIGCIAYSDPAPHVAA